MFFRSRLIKCSFLFRSRYKHRQRAHGHLVLQRPQRKCGLKAPRRAFHLGRWCRCGRDKFRTPWPRFVSYAFPNSSKLCSPWSWPAIMQRPTLCYTRLYRVADVCCEAGRSEVYCRMDTGVMIFVCLYIVLNIPSLVMLDMIRSICSRCRVTR